MISALVFVSSFALLILLGSAFNDGKPLKSSTNSKSFIRKERIGAICNDGWRSYSVGQGACSHHGGVDYWLYSK